MARETKQILLMVMAVGLFFCLGLVPGKIDMILSISSACIACLICAIADQEAEWMEYCQGLSNPSQEVREMATKNWW